MKKILRILTIVLIAILLMIILVLIADKIYCSNLKVEPEDLYLSKENSEEKIKASKGSYEWKEKGIIKEVSKIADSIGPLSFDFSNSIEAKPGEKIYFTDCNWKSMGASVVLGKDRKELARISIDVNLEENYIVVPEMEAGEYVVQINFEAENGNVWYVCQIDIVN